MKPTPARASRIDRYLEEVFLRSDTRFAVVSAIPASDNNGPISTARMDDARRMADRLCGDGRILMHGQALPALGNLDAQLDAMNALIGAVSDRGVEGVHARAVTLVPRRPRSAGPAGRSARSWTGCARRA